MGGDLRVGGVGCGARGGLARLAHAPGRGSRVVGVCEPVPRRQDAAREALDTDGSRAVVPDLDALLGLGLDSVMVLTPDDLHARRCRSTWRPWTRTWSPTSRWGQPRLVRPLGQECDRLGRGAPGVRRGGVPDCPHDV